MQSKPSHSTPPSNASLPSDETAHGALPPAGSEEVLTQRQIGVLFGSILLISICAIVYELLISSLSSYLLGSSILHFSLTIGLFMFFMGVGSYLSKFLNTNLIGHFVFIETAIGLIGGMSAAILYLSYSLTELYYPTAFLLVACISILAGLEIPVVTRILKSNGSLKDTLANILSFDYVGALLASLLFPLVLLPYLGLMKTAFLIGLLNIVVAFFNIHEFRTRIPNVGRFYFAAGVSAILLLVGFVYSFTLVGFFERFIYQDQIIYSKQTAYQRIVITKFKDDLRLFLNGNVQFSSLDEHRYHESITHIPIALTGKAEQVLVLGGGDGLVVREILKHQEVQKITLVDLDKAMIELALNNADLRALNQDALRDPRVQIEIQDAYKFAENTTTLFSTIIIDLPDPNDLSLGKLYSKEFYEILKKRLTADGILVTQSSSPYLARKAFWSIHQTLSEVFPAVVPYTVYVPSFGPWGFQMAANRTIDPKSIQIKVPTRYLNAEILASLFVFDTDMSKLPVQANRLDNQVLVQYYEESMDY